MGFTVKNYTERIHVRNIPLYERMSEINRPLLILMTQHLSYYSFLKKGESGSVHSNLEKQYGQGNHKGSCRLKKKGEEIENNQAL